MTQTDPAIAITLAAKQGLQRVAEFRAAYSPIGKKQQRQRELVRTTLDLLKYEIEEAGIRA